MSISEKIGKKMLWTCGIMLVMMALAVGTAGAESLDPGVYFQGRLTDPSTGTVVPDGQYDMRFSLYESETAPLSSYVWRNEETVMVSNGVVTTTLGGEGIFDGDALWLGIEIEEVPTGWPWTPHWRELLPRMEIRPDAYANSLVPGATLRSFHAQEYSLIRPPNHEQLALLRWWEGNRVPIEYPLLAPAGGIAYDGIYMWTTHPEVANSGAYSNTISRLAANDGNCYGVVHTSPITDTTSPITNTGVVTTWCHIKPSPPISTGVASLFVDPRGVAYDGRYMWVTNHDGQDSTVIRLEARSAPLSTTDVVEVYPMPAGASDPTQIAYDGSHMWIVTDGAELVRSSATGYMQVMYNTFSGTPRDVLFDGTYIWVAHDQGLIAFNRNGTLAPGLDLDTTVSGISPNAITFDGHNIWVSNSCSPGVVTKVRASDGVKLAEYTADGSIACPCDILFDGYNVWVLNCGGIGCSNPTPTVIQLRAYDGEFIHQYSLGNNNSPWSLGFDGENIWVTGENTADHMGILVKL